MGEGWLRLEIIILQMISSFSILLFFFYARRPTSLRARFTDDCRNWVFTGSISPEVFPKLKEVIPLFPHLPLLQHPVLLARA